MLSGKSRLPSEEPSKGVNILSLKTQPPTTKSMYKPIKIDNSLKALFIVLFFYILTVGMVRTSEVWILYAQSSLNGWKWANMPKLVTRMEYCSNNDAVCKYINIDKNSIIAPISPVDDDVLKEDTSLQL